MRLVLYCRIMVWYGKDCKNVLKSKARLMAERINKNERKNKAAIHIFCQGEEPALFWQTLSEYEEVRPCFFSFSSMGP